jgi:guanosine-3',5'-bis(diphosphate) 3'-pyrophosphohydrolase
LERIFEKYKIHSAEDVYALVGEGQITSYEVIRNIYPDFQTKEIPFTPETMRLSKKPRDKESAVSIKGLIPGMAIHYARCCHPLPGDQIIGIVMTGTGVTIHTINCDNLKNYAEEPERWIDVTWDQTESQNVHTGRLLITVANKTNALATITTIISKQNANIINLKIAHRSELLSEFIIDIEVHDTEHLENLIANLRMNSVVNAVERSRG